MSKDRKIYLGVLISIIISISVEIYFILYSNCTSRKIIINLTFGTCVLLFCIKKFLGIKMKLKSEEPEINYFTNIFTNLLLFFNVLNYITINKFNNGELYIRVLGAGIIAKYVIDIISFIIYSEDGKLFILSFILVFILGSFDKDSQENITIITTLLTTIFGRTVLKNIFKTQIKNHDIDRKLTDDSTLENMEYKLSMLNIIVIFTQIIIFATEPLRNLDYYNKLVKQIIMGDKIIIGFIRVLILVITYILIKSKLGKRFKDILFDLLIRD